jgi:transcriptional regulator with PAS, ATPase and Fis domain
VAELIHRNSPRAHRPLVCINCAAIPDSLLEGELFGYEMGFMGGKAACVSHGSEETPNN